ncbi:hypothetical protein PoB_001500300 [Plakobranchus ocellatus]|uniref:Uncharacterized protein n=1 Tax=Plakobranchus ocellatus TaxID=259542 RepID=A0AAV3Z1L6_9GAST|nr:hypothetical protein PoB_001500300 [Plakobranchus ocellatus]
MFTWNQYWYLGCVVSTVKLAQGGDKMKKSVHAGKDVKGKGKESKDRTRNRCGRGKSKLKPFWHWFRWSMKLKMLMMVTLKPQMMGTTWNICIQINCGEEENGDECNKASGSSSYFEDVAGTCAPPELHLQSHIAKGIEKLLSEGLGRDSRDELSKKYHIPTNCPRLDTLQCNPEIFKHASVRARIRDNALQSVQKALTKGLTAISLVLDQLKEDKDSDILEKVGDGGCFTVIRPLQTAGV